MRSNGVKKRKRPVETRTERPAPLHRETSQRGRRKGELNAVGSMDADYELRYSLAQELFGVCMKMLQKYGLELRCLRRLCARADPQGDVVTAKRLFQEVLQLSELVNEWAENSSYVDASGCPKVLPIFGGKRTFSHLANRYFGARTVEDVIDLGCKTRVLERVDGNKVAQLSACVVVTGNPTLVLAHAIYSVRSLLATARHNAVASANDCVLPDRKAGTVLYEDDLPDFVAAMRQPTANLIEMANRWLTARASMRSRQRKKRAVLGMHAYVFRDGFYEGP